MDHTLVKQALMRCSDLSGLKEAERAILFLRGDVHTPSRGAVIYHAGDPLNDRLGILLNGSLAIEQAGGQRIGEISEPRVFGEMAYFTNLHVRTATVRVSSYPNASWMEIPLTTEEIKLGCFSILGEYLGRQAWQRFVDASQSQI